MSSIPPAGQSPSEKPQPAEPVKPSGDEKDAFLLQSPFAKMFARTGVQPTVKEIKAIIDGILKQQILEIKRADESWKKAMRKLKRALEGND